MQKEIYEQAAAITDTISGRVDFDAGQVILDELKLEPEQPDGSGKDRHRRLRHLGLCRPGGQVPDRGPGAPPGRGGLWLRVSLPRPAHRRADAGAGHHPVGRDGGHPGRHGGGAGQGRALWAIVNVIGSQAARLADGVIYMHAGPEIGVASTKAFTASAGRPLPAGPVSGPVAGHDRPEAMRRLLDALLALPEAGRPGAGQRPTI